jgi:ABC-type Fe3+ transport system substrate-binding protein
MTIEEIIKQKKAMYKYFTEAESLEAVKQNGYVLKYVREQTEAICLEAVKQNGYALKYVREQTEAICLEAVKQNGYVLKYVREDLFIKAKELTVDEISKLLGYEVKIIR